MVNVNIKYLWAILTDGLRWNCAEVDFNKPVEFGIIFNKSMFQRENGASQKHYMESCLSLVCTDWICITECNVQKHHVK